MLGRVLKKEYTPGNMLTMRHSGIEDNTQEYVDLVQIISVTDCDLKVKLMRTDVTLTIRLEHDDLYHIIH